MADHWQRVSEAIEAATGERFDLADQARVGGGWIADARKVTGADGRTFFVKTQAGDAGGMFTAEASGLEALAAAEAVRVPEVVAVDESASFSYLVLEFIAMGGRGDGAELGRQLAAMHRHTGAAFGFERDNFIGATPQINTPMREDWLDFYRACRLEPQFRWAREQGLRIREADRLMDGLEVFFENYRPEPSVLHGDLWGGNISFDAGGTPVIFDPAVYHGDREADIAFTEVFGGPGAAFYRAYHEAWPLDDGYAVRKTLYNLYHILNHFNLFGGGYGEQARGMVGRLVREL